MLKKIKWMVVGGLLGGMAFAEPTVFQIDSISQRPESGIVDIMYDLIDPDCHEYFVELVAG